MGGGAGVGEGGGEVCLSMRVYACLCVSMRVFACLCVSVYTHTNTAHNTQTTHTNTTPPALVWRAAVRGMLASPR